MHSSTFCDYLSYKFESFLINTYHWQITANILFAITSCTDVPFLDSPPSHSSRYSRLDRTARSISQPRGKRDSSMSSAYGGGGGISSKQRTPIQSNWRANRNEHGFFPKHHRTKHSSLNCNSLAGWFLSVQTNALHKFLVLCITSTSGHLSAGFLCSQHCRF